MTKLYAFVFLAFVVTGCSKDIFKRFERRIIGTWELVDVDRRGFGGSISDLPFQDGTFIFSEGGQLEYIRPNGDVFQGSYDIGYDYEDGRPLRIHVVNFATQEVRTEYFDRMNFTGTDRFNAHVYGGWRRYVLRFRR